MIARRSLKLVLIYLSQIYGLDNNIAQFPLTGLIAPHLVHHDIGLGLVRVYQLAH